MCRPLQIPAGSLTVDRLIEALNEGRHVTIEIDAAGETHEVALQLSKDGVYSADEPLSRSTYTSEPQMREWLLNQGYAKQ